MLGNRCNRKELCIVRSLVQMRNEITDWHMHNKVCSRTLCHSPPVSPFVFPDEQNECIQWTIVIIQCSLQLEPSASDDMPPGSFFSQYPEFDHDPTAPLVREFQRLSLQRGWKADGKKYRQSRQNCFAQEFEYHYGHASDKLAGWQTLCKDVYISPIPSSINQCKKVGQSLSK